MIDDNNPQPIKDPHVAFGQALVKLAREHGASHLAVQFSLTGSIFWRHGGDEMEKRRYDSTRVQFQWNEGRHGDRASFLLKAEASLSVPEEGQP